jgi:4-hydroxy-2-oxoheptanedioate aldolase
MQMPVNTLKEALRNGTRQIGLWMGLADACAAEMLAGAGFDWLLIDGEHAPNDLRSVLAQLQAAAAYPVNCVVRPVSADAHLIKRYLDIGVQSLIVPMIETPEEAARVVAATRYPLHGHRGVASATTRASRWGRIDRYVERSNAQMFVAVQVESVRGVENLQAIAAVEGVDGVFFGPADLAASMGLLGKAADPRVGTAIAEGIKTVTRAGKAAGTLTADRALAHQYLDLGARLVAVGIDMALLSKAACQLADEFKGGGRA